MDGTRDRLLSADARRWIYGIAAAAIVLLGVYDIVTNEEGMAWLALIASIVGLAAPATALTHITPDSVPVEGEFVPEPPGDPETAAMIVTPVPEPVYEEYVEPEPEPEYYEPEPEPEQPEEGTGSDPEGRNL